MNRMGEIFSFETVGFAGSCRSYASGTVSVSVADE
jgi:hypothetical protein